MDFNGDGTVNDLLPGTSINQFGGDLGKDDLARLVQTVQPAICRQADGRLRQRAPRLALPVDYSFNDGFFTQDLRLSRDFQPGPQSTASGGVCRGLQSAEYAQPGWIRHEPSTDPYPLASRPHGSARCSDREGRARFSWARG